MCHMWHMRKLEIEVDNFFIFTLCRKFSNAEIRLISLDCAAYVEELCLKRKQFDIFITETSAFLISYSKKSNINVVNDQTSQFHTIKFKQRVFGKLCKYDVIRICGIILGQVAGQIACM